MPLLSDSLMERTLILFCHPALETSRANRALMEGVLGMEGVTFHDLYEEYPDFQIDIEREKDLVESHDRIVFQFPFFWYSTPALMKEWFDVVLQYGWAYGASGTALHGKKAKVVTTTGATYEAYCEAGHNRYTTDELLRPLEQTAVLCGMEWQEPLVVYNALHLDAGAMAKEVERYRNCLVGGS